MAGPSAFVSFLAFSDWLYDETRARHGIALSRLAELSTRYLLDVMHAEPAAVEAALLADLGKDRAQSLMRPTQPAAVVEKPRGIPARQARHHA